MSTYPLPEIKIKDYPTLLNHVKYGDRLYNEIEETYTPYNNYMIIKVNFNEFDLMNPFGDKKTVSKIEIINEKWTCIPIPWYLRKKLGFE